MPFGLYNAHSTFQTMINKVLAGYMDSLCVAYLDNILIYIKSHEEHMYHLERIFQWILEHNLFMKLKMRVFTRRGQTPWLRTQDLRVFHSPEKDRCRLRMAHPNCFIWEELPWISKKFKVFHPKVSSISILLTPSPLTRRPYCGTPLSRTPCSLEVRISLLPGPHHALLLEFLHYGNGFIWLSNEWALPSGGDR